MTKIGWGRFPTTKSAADRIGGVVEVGRRFGDHIGSARLTPRGLEQNGRSWYAIKQLDADVAEISLYDEIGLYGVPAKQFIADLKALEASTIRVCINSPGGDVFDAIAIYNSLVSDRRRIETRVDGLAASAAAFIAMAGATVSIAEHAVLMIHNSWGVAIGDKHDMRNMADVLARVDSQINEIFVRATGKTKAQIAAWLDAETWLTADEALEFGFVDTVIRDSGAGSSANASAGLRQRRMRARLAAAEVETDPRAERMRARIELAERDLAPSRRT